MSTEAYHVVPLVIDRAKKKSKPRSKTKTLRIAIPWVTILTGFFLARSLLLDQLLPFGKGFLAANRKYQRRIYLWPVIGVMLGIYSCGSFMDLYPYYISSLILWFFSSNKKISQKHVYWLIWIAISFILIKAPLQYLNSPTLMTWISSTCEMLIAIAGYSIIEPVIQRAKRNRIAAKEVQLSLLLASVFLGVDFLVLGLELRLIIMFYLVLASARLGGLPLASIIGPCLMVVSLLLGFSQGLAILFVTVSLFAGLFSTMTGGLLIGGLLGYLLSLPFPITPGKIRLLFSVLMSGLLVYLTPKRYLSRLERVIPSAKCHTEQQLARNLRIQELLKKKINQLSQIFWELAATLDGVGFIGQQLHSFANIVEQLGLVLAEPIDFAETIEETLWQRLDYQDLAELTVLRLHDGYQIIGKRKSLCGSGWCNQVAKESENLLRNHFQVQGRDCITTGKCGFHIGLRSHYRLDVKTAKLAQAQVSGDSEAVFQLSSNKVGLLISDGMGTGESAASDSLATINLLEKMIKIGFERDLAVKVINQTLLARNTSESFATVDLVVVDLQTGQLEFVKIGSAPSFIKRFDTVDVVQNSSLPIGILNHIDIEPERRQLNEGDFLIMVTDGILECQRDIVNKDEWLRNVLLEMDHQLSCQELANNILTQSIAACNGQINDDMMVIVARLIKEELNIYPYQRS